MFDTVYITVTWSIECKANILMFEQWNWTVHWFIDVKAEISLVE